MEYLAREETLAVTHAEGRDLVFLRPSPAVPVGLDGVVFQGRAGMARLSGGRLDLHPFDAVRMETEEASLKRIQILT